MARKASTYAAAAAELAAKKRSRSKGSASGGLTGMLMEPFQAVAGMKSRELLLQSVSLGLIVSSALMIWKTLMVFSGSESPVVVVLSGSMAPGFQRGDILFLWKWQDPPVAGEITVFNIKHKEIPIVHRVVSAYAYHSYSATSEVGKVELLTKGDANPYDDRQIYAKSQRFVEPEDVMGSVVGYLPYVGMVTIIMNDYPLVKFVLIGFLGLLVITSKE